MPRTLTSYEQAATEFYSQGRMAQRAGEPRENGPSNPDNPAVWDQSWKNPPVSNDPLANSYGAVWVHFYFGWDDARANWPDRGWRNSMSRGWVALVPPGAGVGANQASRLRYLYVLAWSRTREDSTWSPGDGSGYAYPEVGISPAAASWEMNQAKSDFLSNTPPPAAGYRELPGALQTSPTSTPTPAPPPAQTNPIGQGQNWLQTLVAFKFMKELGGGSSGKSKSSKKKKRSIFG